MKFIMTGEGIRLSESVSRDYLGAEVAPCVEVGGSSSSLRHSLVWEKSERALLLGPKFRLSRGVRGQTSTHHAQSTSSITWTYFLSCANELEP